MVLTNVELNFRMFFIYKFVLFLHIETIILSAFQTVWIEHISFELHVYVYD